MKKDKNANRRFVVNDFEVNNVKQGKKAKEAVKQLTNNIKKK